MLRLKNLEKYRKKNEHELDLKYLEDDDNYILNFHRPIKDDKIHELNQSNLHKFVDDVLKRKSINKILYSSNSKAEIDLLIKSSEFVKKSLGNLSKIKLNKNKNNPIDIVKNRNKLETITQINEEIINDKFDKLQAKEIIDRKLDGFHKRISQESKQKRNIEKSNQIVSPSRKKKFDKTFSYIKNKLHSCDTQEKRRMFLPEIKLKMQNVYSRLYHDMVLLKTETEQKEKSNRSNKPFHRAGSNASQPMETQPQNKASSKKLFVKNIFNSVSGKEFTLKITDEIISHCYFRHSGGPSSSASAFNKVKPGIPFKPKEYSLNLLNKKDNYGNTILHLSILDNCIELVEYLLDKGVNLNVKNNDGDTPLHLAIKLNDLKLTNLLLVNHAEIDVLNNKHETPVDLASSEMKKIYNLDNLLLMKKIGV